MQNYNGVINIYKEQGCTSNDVVMIVRKLLHKVKAGHTGTLDPLAEGVLPVCLGRATKIADYIQADDKTYVAKMRLGITTDTEDITGVVKKTRPVQVSKDEIEKAVSSFIGEYNQTPPMYSAIKVKGKKLYELAREGIEIERKSRLVYIHEIKVLEFIEPDVVSISVKCSKGTYIRTLIYDIGEKLSCGACMENLVRTQTGNFQVENAIKINWLEELIASGKEDSIIIPIDKALPEYKKVVVCDEAVKFLQNGNKVSLRYIINSSKINLTGNFFVYDTNDNLYGIFTLSNEPTGVYIKPVVMLL